MSRSSDSDAPITPLPPALPTPSGRLDLEGFSIGHGSDTEGMTGMTTILCPEGAVAAVEAWGSATGTRQMDSLANPRHLASRAHGVVLAGGSGFGLAAADEVVEELERRGAGFDTGFGVVPLVPTAILFDLAFGDPAARPDRALARQSLADAASRPRGAAVPVGSVGAGTGATVGKARGPACGMKGGFGFASLTVPDGVTVAAAVAVNAFGDVHDPDRGQPLAACRRAPDSLELASAEREMAAVAPDLDHAWERNTTLAVILTDAALDRPRASKVAQMAFGAYFRTLFPALSLYDGDLVVTLARGDRPAHVHQVGVLARRALEHAIVGAVTEADGFGLLPAARDLHTDDDGGAPG